MLTGLFGDIQVASRLVWTVCFHVLDFRWDALFQCSLRDYVCIDYVAFVCVCYMMTLCSKRWTGSLQPSCRQASERAQQLFLYSGQSSHLPGHSQGERKQTPSLDMSLEKILWGGLYYTTVVLVQLSLAVYQAASPKIDLKQ